MLLPYSTHLVHYAVIFFTHSTCSLTKMYITQGIAMEFNKNVQWEISGNTTQYYQNATKGFEFLDANFKIKAQSKIAKGKQCTYSSGYTYLLSNMNITERDVELQKENVKSLRLQRETTEKVRTRVVCLVWYTYSSGFTSLQGIIKIYLRILELHANK